MVLDYIYIYFVSVDVKIRWQQIADGARSVASGTCTITSFYLFLFLYPFVYLNKRLHRQLEKSFYRTAWPDVFVITANLFTSF